jgi:hypothetical protein
MTPTPSDKILNPLAPESHVNHPPRMSDAGEPANTTPRAKAFRVRPLALVQWLSDLHQLLEEIRACILEVVP